MAGYDQELAWNGRENGTDLAKYLSKFDVYDATALQTKPVQTNVVNFPPNSRKIGSAESFICLLEKANFNVGEQHHADC